MTITLGDATPGPGRRIYAVGDVHGCADELAQMIERIEADREGHADSRVVMLGDYHDRGPDCRGVQQRLMDWCAADATVACLLGNHDEKLLLALEPLPARSYTNYLRYGGCETLASYGVSRGELAELCKGHNASRAKRLAKIVRENVPADHLDWLRARPRSITIGDYLFAHAGIRPDVAWDKQDDDDLIWIREPFLSHAEPLAKVVIHGHTRQDEPTVRRNRINVDTSCVYGTALTCVVLEGTDHRFLTVEAARPWWTVPQDVGEPA